VKYYPEHQIMRAEIRTLRNSFSNVQGNMTYVVARTEEKKQRNNRSTFDPLTPSFYTAVRKNQKMMCRAFSVYLLR
jgi:hypothetical protein